MHYYSRARRDRSKELEVDNAGKMAAVDTEIWRGSLAGGTSSHIKKAQVCCMIRPLAALIPVEEAVISRYNASSSGWRFPHGASCLVLVAGLFS